MAICPLCGAAASKLHVEIEEVTVRLIARDHPDWVREDGSCPPCLDYYRSLDVTPVDPDPREA